MEVYQIVERMEHLAQKLEGMAWIGSSLGIFLLIKIWKRSHKVLAFAVTICCLWALVTPVFASPEQEEETEDKIELMQEDGTIYGVTGYEETKDGRWYFSNPASLEVVSQIWNKETVIFDFYNWNADLEEWSLLSFEEWENYGIKVSMDEEGVKEEGEEVWIIKMEKEELLRFQIVEKRGESEELLFEQEIQVVEKKETEPPKIPEEVPDLPEIDTSPTPEVTPEPTPDPEVTPEPDPDPEPEVTPDPPYSAPSKGSKYVVHGPVGEVVSLVSGISITEENPYAIVNHKILYVLNGESRVLVAGQDYIVETWENGEMKINQYFFKDFLFQKEGRYTLLLMSEDETGNRMSNIRNAWGEAPLEFTIKNSQLDTGEIDFSMEKREVFPIINGQVPILSDTMKELLEEKPEEEQIKEDGQRSWKNQTEKKMDSDVKNQKTMKQEEKDFPMFHKMIRIVLGLILLSLVGYFRILYLRKRRKNNS